MYLFISENEIRPYQGKMLKKVAGNTLIEGTSNPTEGILREFGYKPLVEAEIPEYNEETHYLEEYYEDGDEITKKYRVVEIPEITDIPDVESEE